MSKITVHAPAKLNLTFEILSLMPDGYHEVRTLLQSIDLCDELCFELNSGTTNGVTLSLRAQAPDDFPLNDDNLIARAAHLFFAEIDKSPRTGLSVSVYKNIPLGAGLAGGSSDAAATLIALNYLHDHPLTTHELSALAVQLGADVPFCLQGGLCLGTRRGDQLRPVDSDTRLFFLLVKPRTLSIATPWIYKQYDEYQQRNSLPPFSPDSSGGAGALKDGNLHRALECFGNVFEPIVLEHFPLIAQVKQELLGLGSMACHITGSGPTLYALISDREMAHYLRRQMLESAQQNDLDLFIVESVGHGARVVLSEAAERQVN